MQYKDYYQTLGVARGASQDEIKKAYRRLARKYHPDVSQEPDAERRFKEINEANEVLRDPKKRAAYDALGSHWRAGQEFRPPPGGAGSAFDFETAGREDFSDFFSSIFGRAFGGDETPRPRQGRHRRIRLELSLEEAHSGVTRQIEVERGGRSLNVRIPAGATEGRQIRLAGQGAPGRNGGPPGDLYLEVRLKPHRLFKVEGRDIHLHLPIAPWEAALGASVTVPTLGGAVALKIPPGSQSGRRLRLKGRGLPGDPPGDQIVILTIHTPPADSPRARELYAAMQRDLAFNPRAELHG
ncbi:MAG: DnaJ domain-containing protein [Chromatiaceae bacterium]|nr:DnaJ domain-containing protein [Chromatiaceae bacterium]